MSIQKFTLVLPVLVLASFPTESISAEPVIKDISWPGIDAYCTFMREGHEFVFDKPETWQFVAFTPLADKVDGDEFKGLFASVNGRLREFVQMEKKASDSGMTFTYSAAADPAILAKLVLGKPARGEEASGYEGALEISVGQDKSSVKLSGSCGV